MNNRHIRVGLLFIAVCILAGLVLAYVSIPHEKLKINGAPASLSGPLGGTDTPSSGSRSQQSVSPLANPDFIVTDALLASEPGFNEVGQGPTRIAFCHGAKARLSNGSTKILNLDVEPNESDSASGLGTIQSGDTLTFDPGNVGVWNILNANDGQPLLQYQVKQCGDAKASAAAGMATASATPSKTILDTHQGECRLTVAGTRYLDGTCNYAVEHGGSFEIWEQGMSASGNRTAANGAGFMARVALDPDGAEGFWNEARSAAHTDASLGPLQRHGACWSNNSAEICLWGKN